MTSKLNLKVLISGAGIAGNALAVWLSRLGHNVTVVEKFQSLRVNGLQLDLRGDGVEVMKRMGIESAFHDKSVPEEGMRVVDSRGRQRAYFPVNKSGKDAQSLTSEFEIMRGDLCRILYDAAMDTTAPPRYIFGTSIESLKQLDDQVDVQFADGHRDRFDLVVGADGQWSNTRGLMHQLGGSSQSQTSNDIQILPGLFFAYFTMPRQMDNGEKYVSTSYLATHKRGIMTRRHRPDKLQVMLSCQTSSERLRNVHRGDIREEKAALAEIFNDAGWIAKDVVEGMMISEDFHLERPGLVKTDPWSRGHVILLGDAAHCPTVLSGMGTTSAMVGAYILAGEIATHVHLDTTTGRLTKALQSYEKKFRPYMDQVQDGILEKANGQYNLPDSAFSIAIINWGLGLASLFRLNIAKLWGVKEVVEGWELPEYKALHEGKS